MVDEAWFASGCFAANAIGVTAVAATPDAAVAINFLLE
jgi:hypothetical protein